jgi:hypothetical protein
MTISPPLALKGLLDEYTSMIKKQKSKLKALDETHEKLKVSYDELFVKHNDLSKEHDALVVSNKSLRDDHNKLLDKHNELIVKHDYITVLNKSLESNHMKLKKEHVILEMIKSLSLHTRTLALVGMQMLEKSLNPMPLLHMMI